MESDSCSSIGYGDARCIVNSSQRRVTRIARILTTHMKFITGLMDQYSFIIIKYVIHKTQQITICRI